MRKILVKLPIQPIEAHLAARVGDGAAPHTLDNLRVVVRLDKGRSEVTNLTEIDYSSVLSDNVEVSVWIPGIGDVDRGPDGVLNTQAQVFEIFSDWLRRRVLRHNRLERAPYGVLDRDIRIRVEHVHLMPKVEIHVK